MSVITKRVVMLAACLLLASAVSAGAQYRHGVVVVPRIQVYSPVYDPLWGPWYPYPYAYAYPYDSPAASVRTDVTPKGAEVYVDGYYAGRADDFDGAFKQLHVAPGGHSITLYLDGFRTETENVYVRPDSTFKLNAKMERLADGQTSAPVPIPARPLRPLAEGQAPPA